MIFKIKNLRWWIISLVTLVTIMNYLARTSLSVAAPTLFKELHITNEQYSYILSAFQIAYTVAQSICGMIMDYLGLKIGFLIFIIIWSLANVAHAWATNWQGLAIFRGIMGIGEASVIPAGVKANADWFPPKERGLAGGIANVGTSIGAMLAPPIVVWCILHYEWESAFVFTGAIGLIVAVLWWFGYESPEKHKLITKTEADYLKSTKENYLDGDIKQKQSFFKLLSLKNTWGISLPRFLADPTWGTISFWLPLYLMSVRHMSLHDIALFAWLPFLASDFGCIAGGLINKFMMDKWKNLSPLNARRIGFTIGAILITPLALVGFVKSPYTAIALVSLCGFAHQMLSTQVITIASDIYKRADVGTVAGIAGTGGWIGILICTLLMGALVKTIGYNPFFVILSCLDLIGAIILWTFVKDSRRADEQSAGEQINSVVTVK